MTLSTGGPRSSARSGSHSRRFRITGGIVLCMLLLADSLRPPCHTMVDSFKQTLISLLIIFSQRRLMALSRQQLSDRAQYQSFIKKRWQLWHRLGSMYPSGPRQSKCRIEHHLRKIRNMRPMIPSMRSDSGAFWRRSASCLRSFVLDSPARRALYIFSGELLTWQSLVFPDVQLRCTRVHQTVPVL